jgi:hypothetical protein
VINQALSYLKWLMAKKVDFFEMLIHKRLPQEVAKRIHVDWKSPRVVCIAESYNRFDIDTAEVVPLRIELLQYRHYEDGLFSLDPVVVPGKVSAAVVGPPVVPDPSDVKPAPLPTLEAHLAKGTEATRVLCLELRSRVFALDESIIERVRANMCDLPPGFHTN